MGLSYLIFRTKRRQRTIPVIPGYRNTSLEFIRNVGRLYFLQNDHRRPVEQQFQFLLNFLRRHYRFDRRPEEPEFVPLLAEKTGVDPIKIQNLLDAYQKIQASRFVSERALINFHSLLEDFYEKCK